MDLKKAFSTRAWLLSPDSFFHRRRPILGTLLIVRSRAVDLGPPHHPEDGGKEALDLAQRQREHEAQGRTVSMATSE